MPLVFMGGLLVFLCFTHPKKNTVQIEGQGEKHQTTLMKMALKKEMAMAHGFQ